MHQRLRGGRPYGGVSPPPLGLWDEDAGPGAAGREVEGAAEEGVVEPLCGSGAACAAVRAEVVVVQETAATARCAAGVVASGVSVGDRAPYAGLRALQVNEESVGMEATDRLDGSLGERLEWSL